MYDDSYRIYDAPFDADYWMEQQKYRWEQVNLFPNFTGIYALCDHRHRPLYCGGSVIQDTRPKGEGTCKRCKRHTIDLRSDLAANHRIEICLVASICSWRSTTEHVKEAEKAVVNHFGMENLLNCARGESRGSKLKFTELESGPTVQLVTDEYMQSWLLNPHRRILLHRLHCDELTRHYILRKRAPDVAKAREFALRQLQEAEEECRTHSLTAA